jgi:hypothetical protein
VHAVNKRQLQQAIHHNLQLKLPLFWRYYSLRPAIVPILHTFHVNL